MLRFYFAELTAFDGASTGRRQRPWRPPAIVPFPPDADDVRLVNDLSTLVSTGLVRKVDPDDQRSVPRYTMPGPIRQFMVEHWDDDDKRTDSDAVMPSTTESLLDDPVTAGSPSAGGRSIRTSSPIGGMYRRPSTFFDLKTPCQTHCHLPLISRACGWGSERRREGRGIYRDS